MPHLLTELCSFLNIQAFWPGEPQCCAELWAAVTTPLLQCLVLPDPECWARRCPSQLHWWVLSCKQGLRGLHGIIELLALEGVLHVRGFHLKDFSVKSHGIINIEKDL